MEFIQLKLFHLIAEHKSFSKAAGKAFRTQSAVSQQIKSLEDELESKFFNRVGPKKVELTPDGILFRDLTKKLYLDNCSIKEKFFYAKNKISDKPIRICCRDFVTSYILPDAIEKTKNIIPGLKLSITNPSHDKYISLLRNDETDFCLGYIGNVPEDIVYNEFYKSEWFLVTDKKHPLAKRKNIRLEELVSYPLTMYTMDNYYRSNFDKLIKSKNLTYQISLETSGLLKLFKFVKMNIGIGIATKALLQQENIDDLSVVDISNILGYDRVGILYRKDKIFSCQAETLLKFLRITFPG
ncbi:MAG TPA: hypothetical protein DD381_05915 [Lentisphaeria bacterium]|nr:MAG: hypothetical protein A2X47_14190 [Lentisphaerae bacterium GWF2_38_69]HBM15861.1 hypothetical protein [Lentisphaeria bacterium]